MLDWFKVGAVSLRKINVWLNQFAPNLHYLCIAFALKNVSDDDFKFVFDAVTDLVELLFVQIEQALEANV